MSYEDKSYGIFGKLLIPGGLGDNKCYTFEYIHIYYLSDIELRSCMNMVIYNRWSIWSRQAKGNKFSTFLVMQMMMCFYV